MATATIEQAVEDLAKEHFELAPDLQRIVWLRGDNGVPGEIRLIEISSNTPYTGRLYVFLFPQSADMPYPVRVAEITPEEWNQLCEGSIALPEGWNLVNRKEFTRPEVSR